MSDVERERETLAQAIFEVQTGYAWPADGTWEGHRRAAFESADAVLAALPGLGWVRRKDMLAEQAAATELTRLSQELDLPE